MFQSGFIRLSTFRFAKNGQIFLHKLLNVTQGKPFVNNERITSPSMGQFPLTDEQRLKIYQQTIIKFRKVSVEAIIV